VARARGGWLQYRELTDTGPALCRTENLVDHHPDLRALLTGGPMLAAAGALLGEDAVLYKDKLNHKLPGAPATHPTRTRPPTASSSSTCRAWWRSTTPARTTAASRSCRAPHDRLWPTDEAGCLSDDVVASLPWQAVPLRAGDTLWFGSRTPHRSGPNRSTGRGGRCTRPTTPGARATCGPPTTAARPRSWPRARRRRPGARVAHRRLPGEARARDHDRRRAGAVRGLGHEHYDEEVGQLAHALQTAAHAEAAGAGDALVAAALLHDVGHLLDLQGGAPVPTSAPVPPGWPGCSRPRSPTRSPCT
jgi:hypothetical protein